MGGPPVTGSPGGLTKQEGAVHVMTAPGKDGRCSGDPRASSGGRYQDTLHQVWTPDTLLPSTMAPHRGVSRRAGAQAT